MVLTREVQDNHATLSASISPTFFLRSNLCREMISHLQRQSISMAADRSYLSHYSIHLCLQCFILQNDTRQNNHRINCVGPVSHQTNNDGRERDLPTCCGIKKNLRPIWTNGQLHCRDRFTYYLDKHPTLTDIVQRWDLLWLFTVKCSK